ncbi:MAG: hypothetical protein P8182_17295 [Deltaproteobacteria bacterium]
MNEYTPSKGLSWNTHALLTYAALQSQRARLLETECLVTGLEDFLSAASSSLHRIIQWYSRLLDCNRDKSISTSVPPSDIRTVDQFVEALKIRPDYSIRYVKVVSPDAVPSKMAHDPSRLGPPGGSYIDTEYQERVSALDILATFSDEPDWGMDQGLFLIERYGYGTIPYGGESGLSSQAPFHMAFLWENPLIVKVLPWLQLSFLEARARIFFVLAQLAFDHDVPYWGWRFNAWAMHYLQDLTQPYHARAFPLPLFSVLHPSMLLGGLRALVQGTMVRLRNHHSLFEAAVHSVLNDVVKRGIDHQWLVALAGLGEAHSGSVSSVMKRCSQVPAQLASRIDETVIRLMSDPRIDDPSYCLDEDDSYRIDQALLKAAGHRPEQFQRVVDLVSGCLVETGRVTRFSLRRVENSIDQELE